MVHGQKQKVFHDSILTEWMNDSANGNVVFWSGIILTALSTIDDQKERDFFLNKTIEYIKHYFDSFQSDGYYVEGKKKNNDLYTLRFLEFNFMTFYNFFLENFILKL